MTDFSGLIRRFREEAGYATARSFYEALGGRLYFECTYRQFHNVESGHSVPQPRLVERLASAFRIAVDEGRAKEFARAYLAALLGRKGLVELLIGALSGKHEEQSPLRRAIKRSWDERTTPLTRAQSDFLCASPENYWSFTILANDRAHWRADDLAGAFSLEPAKVRKALERHQSEGLVAKDKEGRYYCPKAGRVFMHPRDDLFVPKVIPALKSIWEKMSEKKGETLLRQHIFTRASENALRAYFPYLAQGVQGADIYTTHERGHDTSFVMVETVVRRVLPF